MKNKRFIAGAICPECGAQDRIYTFEKESLKYRACIDCDLLEPLRFEPLKSELATRVNQTSIKKEKEEESIVRLIEPQDNN